MLGNTAKQNEHKVQATAAIDAIFLRPNLKP